jgi:hypothetical protein
VNFPFEFTIHQEISVTRDFAFNLDAVIHRSWRGSGIRWRR